MGVVRPIPFALDIGALAARFGEVRATTQALIEPLSEADVQVQSMPDASPAKWHLAHTTWFFETLVLEPYERGFCPHHTEYRVLFNSYYNGIGEQHARQRRGLITRPSLAEVLAYRTAVDARVQALLSNDLPEDARALLTLGLHHEQQHQELILTDLLHLLSCNPLAPAYLPAPADDAAAGDAAKPWQWVPFDGDLVEVGHAGAGFAFDNETPRHRRWLAPFALADRLVTQGEWAAFVDDGGYRDPRWWLSAGWDWVRTQRVQSPLHWRRDDAGAWQVFTLHGLQPLAPAAPVLHVSLYEADAFAQWWAERSGLPCRLPTEAEWEHAAQSRAEAVIADGHCLEQRDFRPRPALPIGGLRQLFGTAWEWTRSAYEPYPGYRAWAGAAGEYNGKFMANQYVLRGGSLASPRSHLRDSYRNFFPADARWQFTGVRLARDVG
jgi:ergothioneine biosynthesis protein EgtB